MPALLARETGISERTWRDGGPTWETLLAKAWSRWPADVPLVDQHLPWWLGGGLYRTLIRDAEAPSLHYARTTRFSAEFDQRSAGMFEAWAKDFPRLRQLLLELGPLYFGDMQDDKLGDVQSALWMRCEAARDFEDLQEPFHAAKVNALFSILAHWDCEFVAAYPALARLRAGSVFVYSMPKLDPAVDFSDKQETPRRRGMAWLPVRRLLDVVYVLKHKKTYGTWPAVIPTVQTRAELIGANARDFLNWRDGSKLFVDDDFRELWGSADDIPWPLFVATTFWHNGLAKISTAKGWKQLQLWDGAYRLWWQHHSSKLHGQDLDGRTLQWPKCFENI